MAQAKKARFEILDVIEATIPEVRPDLAPTAPKIDTIKIDVDKIKIVIGKGGETIDKIIAETGVKIDIDEDGLVAIFAQIAMRLNGPRKSLQVLFVKQSGRSLPSKSGSFGEIRCLCQPF